MKFMKKKMLIKAPPTNLTLNAIMRIMVPVGTRRSVGTFILRRRVNHSASWALVLKKVSASIVIRSRFVSVFKIQDTVQLETGVVTDILWNMLIKIILIVRAKARDATISITRIF